MFVAENNTGLKFAYLTGCYMKGRNSNNYSTNNNYWFTENLKMTRTMLASILGACMLSLVSISAKAAVVYWVPTDNDVNYSYALDAGFSLAMFDLGDFDTSQSNPLLINNGADTGADTVDIVAAGSDFTATSVVSSNSITLFDDAQFVVALTDNLGSWFEPTSWVETAPGTNIYEVTFVNGAVLSIDATPTTVIPVPAAIWLFGSGLLGLIGIARRKNA